MKRAPAGKPGALKRTKTELANMDANKAWKILQTYADLVTGTPGRAGEQMEGWGDIEDADPEFLLASFFRSHAFEGEEYRLPEAVLRERWRIGCKREGKIAPFRTNQGLGDFDKRGQRLPDYVVLEGKVTVIRHRPFVPLLCRYPLAGIYYMRGQMR
jgi:hypothetical protein